MTRILVRFVNFQVGSLLHGAILRMQNCHCIPADERPAAVIRRCARHIAISLLVGAGQLPKHVSLHYHVLHHFFEDCIGDFSRGINVVTDFFKNVIVNLEVLIINRQLSSVHQDFYFMSISLDCAEV